MLYPPRLVDVKTHAWSPRSGPYAGVEKYAMDKRADAVDAEYQRRARKIDADFNDGGGQMQRALRGYGCVVGAAFGWFGEASAAVHGLVKFAARELAEARWRAMGAADEESAVASLTAELYRDWGVCAARARAEALVMQVRRLDCRGDADGGLSSSFDEREVRALCESASAASMGTRLFPPSSPSIANSRRRRP